ncbi:MAG: site-specific integrase [Actinomycetaceae bacterium]|nr:site-specific integrase [Actinomycetaceae bacterium]
MQIAKGIEERILKNGSTVYRVRFRLSPSANPTTETFTDLADAIAFRELIKKVGGAAARKIRDASDSSVAIVTLGEALEAYCAHVDTYAAKGTAKGYKSAAYNTWLAFFTESMPIIALSRSDIEKWVAWQREQVVKKSNPPRLYSSKSIKNAQGILSSVLSYAVANKQVSENVARGVKIPSDRVARQPVFLSPEQFESLAREMPERYRAFVTLLYATGMRFGEASALNAEAFDLAASPPTVRVFRAWKKGARQRRYIGSPKSRKAIRTISLPAGIVSLIEPLVIEAQRSGGLVFHSGGGADRRLVESNFLEAFKRAVQRAGLPSATTPHDLRHSHASELIKNGVPLPVIQDRLGHESIQTTVDRYGHISRDSWLSAADVIGEALKLGGVVR